MAHPSTINQNDMACLKYVYWDEYKRTQMHPWSSQSLSEQSMFKQND